MAVRRWIMAAVAVGVVGYFGGASVAQAQMGRGGMGMHCMGGGGGCCHGGMSMMSGQGTGQVSSLSANPGAMQQLVAMQQMQVQAALNAALYQQLAAQQQAAAQQQQLIAAQQQRAAARQAALTASLPPTRIQQAYNDQMQATLAQLAQRRAAAQQPLAVTVRR
jgi:hypothetical protein